MAMVTSLVRVSILLVSVAACTPSTLRISGVSPRPQIPRSSIRSGVGLTIKNTPDTLRARATGGAPLELLGVHAALRQGFMRGFGWDGTRSERTIALTIHWLDLINALSIKTSNAATFDGASIVLVHGGAHVQTTRVPPSRVARLSYSAVLRDGSTIVAEFAGEAHGTSFTTAGEDQVASSITSAIESMYLEIARQFFERGMASRPPIPSHVEI